MREEYKSPPTPHPYSNFFTTSLSPNPLSALPFSIPDCFPPRTAKDILQSEIRVISVDSNTAAGHASARGCCWRSHTEIETLNAYIWLAVTALVMGCSGKPSIFVFLHQGQGELFRNAAFQGVTCLSCYKYMWPGRRPGAWGGTGWMKLTAETIMISHWWNKWSTTINTKQLNRWINQFLCLKI